VEDMSAARAATPSGAVFLSYASEDSEAAARIAEALRAAGIEAWFDKSELRGGEVWDRQINEQIHRCRLFMPIISANTEARDEGYFRREWGVAVDRMRDMGERKAFLVPVVIDGTGERHASVPERFRQVQWTRLPSGEPSPPFVNRIAGLLGDPIQVIPTDGSSRASASILQPRRPTRQTIWVGVGALAIAIAVWLGWRQVGPRAPAASSNAVEKSIAVLPFVDMSEKHDQEYFSDGLAEELLDQLAKTPGLHVIARTSSFYFKGKQVPLGEIAKALNVATVLEGSVRKSGDHIRVTTQLIRVDRAEHLWSETYDRDMRDVFEVQDDIAGAVVKALKLTLQVGSAPSDRTANTEAYALLLKGRYLFYEQFTPQSTRDAAVALDRAVQLEPTYAAAWAQLARVYFHLADDIDTDPGPDIELARAAIKRAMALNPNDAATRYISAHINMAFEHDPQAAAADVQAAERLDPNLTEPLLVPLVLGCVSGPCFEQHIRSLSRDIERDPLSALAIFDRGFMRWYGGDLVGAESDLRRVLQISPKFDSAAGTLAELLIMQNKLDEALPFATAEESPLYRRWALALYWWAQHRKEEAQTQLNALLANDALDGAMEIAEVYAAFGDKKSALDWMERDYDYRRTGVLYFGTDPMLKPVADDPRFTALMKRIGYPLKVNAPN
jgi:TolB-like protein